MTGRTARFDPHPSTEAGYRGARRYLRRAFTRWASATGVAFGPDSFEELVHYKWGYLDGHLTRWRRADLDKVLLELFPAKVIVEADDLQGVVPEAQTFFTFLADTGLLDPESEKPEQLRVHLGKIERRFIARMADRSRYSWGKRFWLGAAEAGVTPADKKAVAVYIETFNARPEPERRAVLGRDGSVGQLRGRLTLASAPSQLSRSSHRRGRDR
ncbi:MAG: hypothetical protein ACRDX8_11340 [Acidimicrobiales bacterium]